MAKGLKFTFDNITIPRGKEDAVFAALKERLPLVQKVFSDKSGVHVETDYTHQPSFKLNPRAMKPRANRPIVTVNPDDNKRRDVELGLREVIASLEATPA